MSLGSQCGLRFSHAACESFTAFCYCRSVGGSGWNTERIGSARLATSTADRFTSLYCLFATYAHLQCSRSTCSCVQFVEDLSTIAVRSSSRRDRAPADVLRCIFANALWPAQLAALIRFLQLWLKSVFEVILRGGVEVSIAPEPVFAVGRLIGKLGREKILPRC